MQVPFLDLKRQYESIKADIHASIAKVFESSAFSAGPFVAEFEASFARAHHAAHCVGVNNGTSALHLALMALSIGPRDEVIVPTNTFFATAEAVSLAGARPVFVDCEPEYYNINPELIEQAITPRTKAIMAVHLYGQMAQVEQVQRIAEKHGIVMIEDCAQSHLATLDGRSCGTTGVCGCFSFYPGKNLGAAGEGGAVITNDESLAHKMQALRNHGSHKKYYHEYVGHNYRLEGIQGAVLSVKLKELQRWTENRIKNADLYRKRLATLGDISLPSVIAGATHVYHLFVIRAPQREKLIAHLEKRGVSTGIHYPVPCHMQAAYKELEVPLGSLPIAERYCNDILSLPMFAELTEAEVSYVCDAIKEFYGDH